MGPQALLRPFVTPPGEREMRASLRRLDPVRFAGTRPGKAGVQAQ